MQKQSRKRQKHQQKPEYTNLTPFKEVQKHFKLYQHQETDFSLVYHPPEFTNIMGYQVAQLPYPEGAYLVKAFNPPLTVYRIAHEALNQYHRKPYRTNLDSRQELYQQEKNQDLKQEKTEETVLADTKREEEAEEPPVTNAGVENEEREYYFNDKIRWANVGYQYDWTQRKYPEVKTQIPEAVQELCERANRVFNAIRGLNKEYRPESAIINYYGEKDSMTGHLDDAEIDQDSPIYSFSFGLSCIFLIGGKTKEMRPIAVRLDSGDLLIMGGQARLAYHGVPRIMANTFAPQQLQVEGVLSSPNSTKHVGNYLSRHRININVRQVYPSKE